MMTLPTYKTCSACGTPMALKQDRCPYCHASQAERIGFARQMWGLMIISVFLVIGSIAVALLALRQSGIGL